MTCVATTADGLGRERILFAQPIGIRKAHRVGNGAPETMAVMDCGRDNGGCAHSSTTVRKRQHSSWTYKRLNAASVALGVDKARLCAQPRLIGA